MELVGCGGEVWRGAVPLPQKKIFLYNGPVVRVSASHSSDLPHVEVVGVRRRSLHGEGAVLPPQEKIFLYNGFSSKG